MAVHGVEYAFGAHEQSNTGIFEVEPKRCPGFTFRKSILIGKTDMDAKEVQLLLQKLATEYSGNTYNLITRNCNHFCNDLCMRLTKKSIPNWVNRLARLGNNLHGCYFSLHSIFYFLIFWVVGRVGLLQSICIYLGLKICLLSWVVGCYHL